MRQTRNPFVIRKNSTLPEHQHPLQDETLVLFLKTAGKKEASIRFIHKMMERRNFLAMLSITLALTPEAMMDFSKSLL